MLGYVSEKEARQNGFTHHASYYGVPIWWRSADHAVWCKHPVFEYLFDAAAWVESTMRPILFPDEEPCFQFKIGVKIK